MKFKEFIDNLNTTSFKFNKRITCFVGDESPLLFFSNLFELLKAKSKFPAELKKINLNSKDKAYFYSSLTQSFLGQSNFYWLGDIAQVFSSKNKVELLKFLSTYKGPHFISFFLPKDEKREIKSISKNIEIIEIENNVDKSIFIELLDLFEVKTNKQKLKVIGDKIFLNSTYSLDVACMLMKYFELINIRYADEFSNYLSSVLGSQPSLYTLSDAFFAKKEKFFFDLWQDIGSCYSDMFWISFWSDQIFRAYYVVKFLEQKDFVKAKRSSFRLPYNFMKRDYKQFSLEKLANYYEFLFNIDFAIKKGSSFCSLDLFYLNHFVSN